MKIAYLSFTAVVFIALLSACGDNAGNGYYIEPNAQESESSFGVGNYVTTMAQAKERDIPNIENSHSTAMEEIIFGNFQGLRYANGEPISEHDLSFLNSVHERQSERQVIEWLKIDINNDGLLDLGIERVPKNLLRLVAVFANTGDEIRLAQIMTQAQMTSFFILSDNGNLIYTCGMYGLSAFRTYQHHKFNADWELVLVQGLDIINISAWAIYGMKEDPYFDFIEFVEQHPLWAEPEIHYWSFANRNDFVAGGEIVSITEYQFLELFEEMTGVPLAKSPIRPAWID